MSSIINVPLNVPEGADTDPASIERYLSKLMDLAHEETFNTSDETDRADKDTGALPTLPNEFWQQTDTLQRIRQAAFSIRAAPDSTLLACLARIAASLPPGTCIDTGLGTTPLILFAGMVAPSGMGKSQSSRAARRLIELPAGVLDGVTAASGEALITAYMHNEAQTRHNVYFYVDEGEYIIVLNERSGSAFGSILRQAFMGQPLDYRTARSVRHVESYAMGFLAGFQPDVGYHIVQANNGRGTIERFLWVNARLADAPEHPKRGEAIAWPGRLDIPGIAWTDAADDFGTANRELAIDPRIQQAIREWHDDMAYERIEVDPLDKHSMLIRARLAALLAILHRGTHADVTMDDFRMAGQVWRVSCGVRNDLIMEGEQAAKQTRKMSALQIGERNATAKSTENAIGRCMAAMRNRCEKYGPQTRRDLHRASGRYRQVAPYALEIAISSGALILIEGKYSAPTE